MDYNEITARLQMAGDLEWQARAFRMYADNESGCTLAGYTEDNEECLRCDESQRAACVKLRERFFSEIDRLTAESFAEYEACAEALRPLAEAGSEEAMAALAEVLLDMDTHSFSQKKELHERFWEAEYWYLRLFYTFGKEEYMDKARMMEAFRSAEVTCLDEEDGTETLDDGTEEESWDEGDDGEEWDGVIPDDLPEGVVFGVDIPY